ncbi:putative SP-containing protein [Vairimorpha necatrix]|uniref:SP-containing protein n=1 Tax=Vairimorpha necatrix TaxID=6039 RepID=A0AAX4JFG6_9MICR
MNNKNKLLIFVCTFSMSLMFFLYWHYFMSTNTITITDQHINKLNIDSAIDALQSRGKGYTRDQYKSILIALGIYSNVRSKMIENELPIKKIIIDNFMLSLNNFVFSRKNGIEECLESKDESYKFVKEYLNLLITPSERINLPNDFKEYTWEPFALLKKKVEEKYKDVIETINKTMLAVTINDINKDMSACEVVWGSLFTYLSKVI